MKVKIVSIESHNNQLYGVDDAGGLWLWVDPLDDNRGHWRQIAGGIERAAKEPPNEYPRVRDY